MTTSSAPPINYDEIVREDSDGFWVSGRVYNDPAIFEDEVDKIFTRGWVFIGHESEIPEPGDYRTRQIGLQPIMTALFEHDEGTYGNDGKELGAQCIKTIGLRVMQLFWLSSDWPMAEARG